VAADLIYGIHPVREALQGKRRRPLEIWASPAPHSPRLQEVLQESARLGIPVRQRERRDLDKLAGHRHHQGVVLRLEAFGYIALEDLLAIWKTSQKKAFFLVLDGITDPHNLGAILRSAEAAGCHGVIVPRDRTCPVTPVVDKTSAGALEHIPLCQVVNLSRTLETLKGEGLWVFGLGVEEGALPVHSADLHGDLVLVVGSEGGGMRRMVREKCDFMLSIPMRGRISSLNASVAAAIALFEAARQRTI